MFMSVNLRGSDLLKNLKPRNEDGVIHGNGGVSGSITPYRAAWERGNDRLNELQLPRNIANKAWAYCSVPGYHET